MNSGAALILAVLETLAAVVAWGLIHVLVVLVVITHQTSRAHSRGLWPCFWWTGGSVSEGHPSVLRCSLCAL